MNIHLATKKNWEWGQPRKLDAGDAVDAGSTSWSMWHDWPITFGARWISVKLNLRSIFKSNNFRFSVTLGLTLKVYFFLGGDVVPILGTEQMHASQTADAESRPATTQRNLRDDQPRETATAIRSPSRVHNFTGGFLRCLSRIRPSD